MATLYQSPSAASDIAAAMLTWWRPKRSGRHTLPAVREHGWVRWLQCRRDLFEVDAAPRPAATTAAVKDDNAQQ